MRHLALRYFPALFLGCLLSSSGLAQQARSFSFAVVPQYDGRTLHSTWQPILDYLESTTGYHFVLATSPDIPSFSQRLNNGVFDFAYANPMQFLQASRLQHYRPVLRDGSRNLQGIVVVRDDSEMQQIEQLRDQPMAFPAPNALGATLLVRYELDKLHGVSVDPRYVKTHNSAYLQVATGRLPAAGGVVSTLLQQPTEVRDRLRIIYRTEEVSPHPIAAHPRVGAEAIRKFTQAFLALAQTRNGQAWLASIPLTQPIAAVTTDYRNIETYDLTSFTQ